MLSWPLWPMPRLPRISGRELVDLLVRQGFEVVRVRGSHHFLTNGEARTSVPVHASRMLKVGTLRGVLRDVDISPAEFAKLIAGR